MLRMIFSAMPIRAPSWVFVRLTGAQSFISRGSIRTSLPMLKSTSSTTALPTGCSGALCNDQPCHGDGTAGWRTPPQHQSHGFATAFCRMTSLTGVVLSLTFRSIQNTDLVGGLPYSPSQAEAVPYRFLSLTQLRTVRRLALPLPRRYRDSPLAVTLPLDRRDG